MMRTGFLLAILEFCPCFSEFITPPDYSTTSEEFEKVSSNPKDKDLYILPNKVKLCWSDALFYCRDRNLDLLTVQSKEEQAYMENKLRSHPYNLTEHVWLGLRRRVMGSWWFWMSGVEMTYDTKWKKGSVWQTTSPCGAVRTKDGFSWTDVPCGTPLHFICHTPPVATPVYFWSSTKP